MSKKEITITVKGVGSPLIVVSSAVSDALEPFNVEIKSSHVTSEDILQQLIDWSTVPC